MTLLQAVWRFLRDLWAWWRERRLAQQAQVRRWVEELVQVAETEARQQEQREAEQHAAVEEKCREVETLAPDDVAQRLTDWFGGVR